MGLRDDPGKQAQGAMRHRALRSGWGVGVRGLLTRIAITAIAAGSLAAASGCGDSDDRGEAANPWEGAKRVEVSGLEGLSAQAGHRVYWAGERSGRPVGVSIDSDRNVNIRYLPDGVDPAVSSPNYFNVASYPFPGAYDETARLAGNNGNVRVKVPGAVAFYPESRPTSVILSFRKSPDVQVEIFDPDPKKALKAARSGAIVPVP